MPKPDPYRLLTDLVHYDSEVDQLAAQIDRLNQQCERHEAAVVAAIDELTPLFARLPADAAIEHHGMVFWLDADLGVSFRRLRPWLDLLPADAEPEPIRSATPPVILPAPETVKPLSYGELMATQRYTPEPIIGTDKRIDDASARLQAEAAMMTDDAPLTDAQIDEGSESVITPEMETDAAWRVALRDVPGMPDVLLETLAEAWDRDEDAAIQRLVGTVTLHRNGEAP